MYHFSYFVRQYVRNEVERGMISPTLSIDSNYSGHSSDEKPMGQAFGEYL